MSFPEEDVVSADHPLRPGRNSSFLLPVLFALVGAAVWLLASTLWHVARQNAITESVPPGNEAPLTSGEPLPASVPSEPSIESPASTDGSSLSAVSVGVVEAPPRRKPPAEWRLRGRVYDLITLQPLEGCSLIFIDASENRRIETRTAADGRYRVVVPPLLDRGYMVSIFKRGYAPSYLNPGAEGVGGMSPSARANLAGDLAATLAPDPHSVQAHDERPLVTDFYLAPRP